jgi:transposase
MFQDEARVGRISDPKACWAQLPVRPEIGAQMIREYAYVFGAVSPQDGQHDSLVLPCANAETMSIFLEEVGRRHSAEYIVMFVDQAGWHKAKRLCIPKNMEIAFLPPYSPDLNPQEQIWDEMREKFFGNRVFKSLQAVINAAAIGLQELETHPERIKSLVHRKWILNVF